MDNSFKELLLESENIGLIIFNSTKNVEYVNSFFSKSYSYEDLSFLINPTVDAIINMEDRQFPFNGFITFGTKTESISLPGTIIKKEDTFLIKVERKNEFTTDNVSKLSNLLVENTNLQRELIKEKKLTEEHLKEIQNLLKELNKFIGTAAHDLRNPIGVAWSFAQLLLTKKYIQENEKIEGFVSLIADRCKFSIFMVNELLDLSKIESGTVTLRREKINYETLCKETAFLNETLSQEKGSKITLLYESNNKIAYIDRNRIEQVLNNLIGNAVKFSPPNALIILRVVDRNNSIVTEIHDSGPGIPPDELETIFAPFNNSTNRPTKDEKSTGLGLAICKKLVEVHNGNVFVKKSDITDGANFWFTLPLQ